MMESQGIITVLSRKKIAEARRGLDVLPVITKIGLGDGGADEQDNVLPPTENDLTLKHELIRRNYDSVVKLSDTAYRYRIDIKKGELTGKNISEIALYDSTGGMLAAKSFHPYNITEDMEISFEIDDIF